MHKQYEKLLNKLKAEADAKYAGYPQYKNYWEKFVLVRMEQRVDTKFGIAFLRGEVTLGDGGFTAYSLKNNVNTKISTGDYSVISPDENPLEMGPTWKDCLYNALGVHPTELPEGLWASLIKDEGEGDALVVEEWYCDSWDRALKILNAWVTKKEDVNLNLENYESEYSHSDIKVYDMTNFGKEFGKVHCYRRYEFES